MFGSLVLIVAALAALLALLAWRPAAGSAGGPELCWSCGIRDDHKLWCPNR
jgi:hypothetical protein